MTPMSRHSAALLIAYIALIVYGTWFPIGRWDWSIGGWQAFMAMDWPERIPRSDLIINLVVYLPLGLLVGVVIKRSIFFAVPLAALAGLALSCCLEYGQTYLPGRITSGSDIVLNTLGAALGALGAGMVMRSTFLTGRYEAVVSQLRKPGKGHLGLSVLVLWVLAQWAPFVPSLDFDNIKRGLAPFKLFIAGDSTYFLFGFVEYLAMLGGLLALGLRLFKFREQASLVLILCMFVVLCGKVLIMTRQLAPEALLAGVAASIFALWLRRRRSASLKAIALICLLVYQVVASFTPGLGDPTLRQMNWVPFRGQMNSVSGIIDLIEPLWLFTAYAYLMYPRRSRSSGGLALRLTIIAPLALMLEWAQQIVPGRYPDVTDVVVAIAAFVLAYSFPWRRFAGLEQTTQPQKARLRQLGWSRSSGAVAIALVALFLLGRISTMDAGQGTYSLPAVDALANPALTGFSYRHPRLPAPGRGSWNTLQRENPEFIEKQRDGAKAEKLYAQILIARMETGKVDLERLFNRLLALEFSDLGETQTIPIALAYDWLHDDWTPTQRALLLVKTEQACRYQIDVIRNRYQLSPYNASLYNRPLQALMMASLAIHGDSPNGECMRFTYDYWKNRVLPVWRQVMGQRGGWHEGGEHLAAGIGKAVHSLPAMWRKATGEDLFASLSGLRGFLDFTIYRQRPDGTTMRLGDASRRGRQLSDLAALALEYRHRAAYTAASPPKKATPLGFPWGPLSDNRLIDESARERMPVSKWFDGIGLLVARSDWSDDATYLTAKAGNNFWSHVHLDQGAFTLFKGEALAIDSGVDFDHGGDHHMNYAYQSIAHNVVTITDADENSTAPANTRLAGSKRNSPGPRQIANDGGQRRVGAGWGRRAPLDRSEWEASKEHYRTVGRRRTGSSEDGNMVWINADLTPAYNNDDSRDSAFFARAYRADEYLRTLVYLRNVDVVVVHDRLRLSKSNLRTRWLLHSQSAPEVEGSYFSIQGTKARLLGEVLLPKGANLVPIGGPGFEFFVASKNYDQDGAALKAAAKNPFIEAGAWRLEVQADSDARNLDYLVVLHPSFDPSADHPRPVLKQANGAVRLLFEDQNLQLTLPRSMEEPLLRANF